MGDILATQWFYAIGDERFGPVTGSELKVLARTGVLHPADLVFKEGMPDWQPARKVKSLWVSRRSVADTSGVGSKPPPMPAQDAAPAPQAAPVAEQRPQTSPQAAPQPTATAIPEAPWFTDAPAQPGFSEALSGAFAHAGKAAALLIRRPLQLTFFTMTLLVLFATSLTGVITSIAPPGSLPGVLSSGGSASFFTFPLFPLFLMGYLTVLKQIVQGEQPSLAAFLAFTRHGVSCLWHLLMLLAAYLVTLAGIASVLIVIGTAFYFVAGTIMLGLNTVGSVGSTPGASQHMDVSSMGGVTVGGRGSLADSAVELVQALTTLIISTLMVTGFTALQIVFSYLALDVASKNPHLHGAGFVYEAYVETLAMFGRRWVEILLCALLAGAAVLLTSGLLMGAAWLFNMVRLAPLAMWVRTIAAPLLQLALGLFLLVFQATTCLSLREREAAFVR